MAYSSSAYNAFQSNPSGGLKPLPGATAVQVAFDSIYKPSFDSSWVQANHRLSKIRVYFVQEVPNSNPKTYVATPAFNGMIGNKIVVVRRTSSEQLIYLDNCTGVTFQNVTFRSTYGLTIEVSGGRGFSMNGVKFVRPQNSQIIVAPGDGLHFHDATSGPTVENCLFDGLADDAINIYAHTSNLCSGFVIRNNTFQNIRGRAALIQAGYGLISENKITDLTRWGLHFANEDGGSVGVIRDVLVRNNGFYRVADDTNHGGFAIKAENVLTDSGGGLNIWPQIIGNKLTGTSGVSPATFNGSTGTNY
jgi:hypothetical protein